MYWTLDVKNDSNQALKTSEYWALPSTDDPENADGDSLGTARTAGSAFSSNVNVPGDDTSGQNHDPVQHHPPNASTSTGNDWVDYLPSGPVEPLDPVPGAPENGVPITQGRGLEDPHPQEQSIKDFSRFLFGTKGKRDTGNWLDLAATSLNWGILDFAFYLLNVNSAHIVPDMFATPDSQAPYAEMFSNSWHTLVAQSIGAVLGGAIAIKIMNNFSRKKIQMWGFLALALLFMVLGVLYITMLGSSGVAVIIAIYVLCQLTFNIGQQLHSSHMLAIVY